MLAIAAMRESSSLAAAEGAVQKHREPTPDHPPYSWMIGEAIAALGEGGGSAEDAISGFIRARHPGVPAAHDRFLRHYLAKHVAEGLFVCTAPGRYSCRADDDEDEPVLALEEGPAAEPKRGRGRPRRRGLRRRLARRWGASRGPRRPSAGASPAAPPPAAEGAASPATEGKRGPGRPRKDGSSLPATKKGDSGSPSATPKRRGRPRVLPLTTVTDISGKELVRDMKDGPSTTDNNHGESRELALVVVNDGSTVLSVTEDDGGEAPSAKLPLMAKEPATFTTPERSNEPCKLALVAAEEDCAPPPLLMRKEPATFTTPECSTKPDKLALVAADEDSAPLLDADKEDGTKAPFEGSALPLDTDNKDGTQAPFEDSAPLLVPGKEDGTQALFEGSALELVADKEEGTQTPLEGSASVLAFDKEDDAQTSFRGCALALGTDKDNGTLTPFESSAPAPGTDNDAFTEPAFTNHKRRRRTCKSAPVKATRPGATPIAENQAAGKAVSAAPKGQGQESKPASGAAGELRPRRRAPKPRKMLLLNHDNVVPDNRIFCVLALPAPVPAATKA